MDLWPTVRRTADLSHLSEIARWPRWDRPPAAANRRLKTTSVVLLALTFVQLYLGALVAGLRAGRVYNTWPDIDGGFIPSAARLFFDQPWWRNLFDNALTVQFEHRMVAYALFALAGLHALDAIRSRAGSAAVSGALWLAAAITLQATLGLTVFMVTHDLDSLYAICDRVAVLGEGRVIAIGPISELLGSSDPWIKSYFHGKRGSGREAAARSGGAAARPR